MSPKYSVQWAALPCPALDFPYLPWTSPLAAVRWLAAEMLACALPPPTGHCPHWWPAHSPQPTTAGCPTVALLRAQVRYSTMVRTPSRSGAGVSQSVIHSLAQHLAIRPPQPSPCHAMPCHAAMLASRYQVG